MADPAYNVVLNAGEAAPTTVTLRSRPSPLAAVTFAIITLFAGEASPSTVMLRSADQPTSIVTGVLGPPQPNLVFNGDMELDSGWASKNTPVVNERSTEQVHSGSYSRKLVADSIYDGIESQQFSTVAGRRYRVSAWAYSTDPANTMLFMWSGDGSHLPVYSGFTGSANTWVQFTADFIESYGGSLSSIGIQMAAFPSTVYLDDVRVQEDVGVTLDDLTLAATGTTGGASGVIGTLSQTLAALTLAGTGTNLITGTASPVLGALTLAGTATHPVTGTASPTLGALTLAGAGGVLVTGTSSPTLAALTSGGTGTVLIQGTLSRTLADLTVAGTGTVAAGGGVNGNLNSTLADLTGAGVGTVLVSATATPTFASLTLAGTATHPVTGTASPTLGALTLSGVGGAAIAGTLARTLADATLAGTGTVTGGAGPRTAVLNVTFDDATLAAAGTAAQPPIVRPPRLGPQRRIIVPAAVSARFPRRR